MANRDFIENRNISEDNCFLELMQTMDANFENEISLVEHSPYYNDDDFRNTVDRVSGSLRILNLNCGGLNAKFDKLKIFLAECNNNFRPISVIALQETHLTNDSDINSFQLPDYNFVYDLARINTFGGVAFYVHKSFSFERLPANEFNQTSPVYESMLLEIYGNENKYKKYIVGNVYRRPSGLSADLSQFIDEFTEVLNKVHASSRQAYINGDFNIDLLTLNHDNYANTFYENMTSEGFFPKITRPTRSCNNSHSLIDNILSNNLCKPHTSGILTHHISDHFMNFCIIEGRRPNNVNKTTHVEFEQINAPSIANFKNSISNADIISKLDIGPSANPNVNYNILSDIITTAKANHIPKRKKKK